MANYQNHYAATTQIADPGYPISQIDEAANPISRTQDYVDDEGKREGKGLKEKIKEKLPGLHKDKPSATTTASSGEEHLHEKKGIMDKVKEKLLGPHH